MSRFSELFEAMEGRLTDEERAAIQKLVDAPPLTADELALLFSDTPEETAQARWQAEQEELQRRRNLEAEERIREAHRRANEAAQQAWRDFIEHRARAAVVPASPAALAARTLGVAVDAPKAVATGAYRALMLRHHPDRGGDPEKAKAINAAWETLKTARGW